MASGYPFQEIEKKWQDSWEREGIYHAKDLTAREKSQKFYGLVEFPYPSGEGLHVGHPRSYTAIDIMTRKQRMMGKNVLYPIGWDAFGLPTENFAIKNKIKPAEATVKNIANFKRQIQSLGIGFDWSREINTTDPKYYKWTQWMFLQFFGSYFDEVEGRARPIDELAIPVAVQADGEVAVRAYVDSKRMAYKAESTINWCPRCKIGLANEEAQGGVCERCGTSVEQRQRAQWMIRITAYAERLVKDLDSVDYLDRIRSQQTNWIGRSEGAYVDFGISSEESDLPDMVTVFTTRPDTLFGATYIVLAPEHPLIATWMKEGVVTNVEEIREYQNGTQLKSDLQRQEMKEKTGVEIKGIKAKNPANGEMISVWMADYVLGGYGTGAIMAVPAHDERDFAFAKMFGLPMKIVVSEGAWHAPVQVGAGSPRPAAAGMSEGAETAPLPMTDEGTVINSGMFDGLATKDAKEKMIAWLKENNFGERKVTYRLRDWVFSRQRYWGEPIPMVICKTCGFVPVPEAQLPLVLPEVEAYEPTDTGESPLAAIRSWVEVDCPKCGEKAERETDTMPNWAGSSWYFLRYCDPHNDQEFASQDKLKFWMPVDLYNGGMEHTTLHLLYSRFWYKFLWDLDIIPRECGSEPYAVRRSHAMILGEGGVKMSKSKGNVVNPDDVVAQYGADVFRVYEMFIGPFDADAPWDTRSIEGVKRFLEKIVKLSEGARSEGARLAPVRDQNPFVAQDEAAFETLVHQTVKKVGEDIEGMRFNTAVSAMMILVNAFAEAKSFSRESWKMLLQILAPFAPHVAEELWQEVGEQQSIHVSGWPKYDAGKIVASSFEMVVQVNGKVRDKMMVDSSITEEEAVKMAMGSDKVRAAMDGKTAMKTIYIKGRLVSVQV